MLRYCALMSLFCSALLVSAIGTPGSTWADEPTTPATEPETPAPTETTPPETTSEETEETVTDEKQSTEEKPKEETSAEAEGDDPGPFDSVDPLVQTQYALDNLLLFLCAVLVIFMQPGFAMVEAGFNASKNTVNILFKNVMDLCIGVLLYYVVGYGLMYPGEYGNGFIGFAGSGVSNEIGAEEVAPGKLFPQVDFLFQVAFAATAATIVSGAVAGRLQFKAYLIYSAILTGLIYPLEGFWKWGGGWLSGAETEAGEPLSLVMKWFGAPFHDFAGSLVVHACGGFAGLAGAIVLGPRIGRFSADGKPNAMPGHNLTFATLGVFVLWVGWYGFNPGSMLVFSDAASVNGVMLIATNTTLAAAAGGLVAMLLSWMAYKKPDLSMALNGILGGLVGITANCDQVSNVSSIIIGAVAGALILGGVKLLDKCRIDDPVGAWPVHGLCGVWGGIATGIFGTADKLSMGSQLVGSIVIPIWAFGTMFILFSILKAMGMLRVSPEEESVGLDISEHGMPAYTH